MFCSEHRENRTGPGQKSPPEGGGGPLRPPAKPGARSPKTPFLLERKAKIHKFSPVKQGKSKKKRPKFAIGADV